MSKLYEARLWTRGIIEEIAQRGDLADPVLDVGPMIAPNGDPHSVFTLYPDTFVDARVLFESRGHTYKSVGLDPESRPDILSDFMDLESESVGTLLLFHVIEHVPDLMNVHRQIQRILKHGGRAFIIVPFCVELHAPYPDFWRISENGFHALFQSSVVTTRSESHPFPAATYVEVRKID